MPPRHRRPGARVVLGTTAEAQAREFTQAQEIAVDRALAALSADPLAGVLRPRLEHGGPMWEYRPPDRNIRIVYTMTALRTVVIVAYFEV